MKAMIFAAGLGTRLKPLTDTKPKALVSILGKPLLQYIIEKLKATGFGEIIINVHHFADQIIDFVHANNDFGIRIEFSDERGELLDTGGGIKKAMWFFDDDEPFLVHNVDILSNIDLQALYRFHLQNDAIATLVTAKRITSRYLLFDHNNSLKGWINKKTGEIKSSGANFDVKKYDEFAFSGIHMLSPQLIRYMESFPNKFSIIDFYLSVCGKIDIQGYVPEHLSLLDVGKIDSLQGAEQFVGK